ncbi:hypothetical protein ASPWEDRAFT_34801 [Aspergillus wentii DTO 134E9]|uniref:U3 small nucleolar ribonucleoprotein protein MPP10 n=1 Tax=Aspergillus wentii DTO 134E9 TaxID=1073089 RepID=A0A1L9S288_ASPWE|nr:uncharacterized protein ASPWEDRAFT_34801 [Aspergillus wentii DTO 134E9]KAI9924048.1 U3 snoRNP protein [Aspergillus wentii]OJJ41276.1 hypothetical protein ASPWEDRAFT_34801 [Aspergillus wentii DTO 134E9]
MTANDFLGSLGSAVVNPQDSHSAAQFSLNSALSTPWSFVCPTTELHTTVVETAKRFLDTLAVSISDSQSPHQQGNKKRKRSEIEQEPAGQILQLKQLYVEGFTPDQIWEQATRILDFAGQEVEHDYARRSLYFKEISSQAWPSEGFDDESFGSSESERDNKAHIEEDHSSADNSDDANMESVSETEDPTHNESDVQSSMEEIDEYSASVESHDESNRDTYTQDRFGLNDGFFSIDDFNKQSEMFEREDAKGGPNEDSESDEEEIDWHANPLAAGNSKSFVKELGSNNKSNVEYDDMSDSDEGPTFGNANLQGQSDSEDDEIIYGDGQNGTSWINTSDIKYSDFFAPPPRKVASNKTRPLPKTQPDTITLENDVNRAMADVRRDLFEDEASGEDEGLSNDDANHTQDQQSTHEKQRARIADEIRRLEAANVAKKEWMLAGEARAVERPVNSLIEEDLDFERIGKPVPVVTTEVSEDIEELVKRRILAREFDEVIRRRPGVSDRQHTRKSRFELEDTKPQQSLAELYEIDHLRATDPNYVDPKNQKLMREHAEITNLWGEISSQLDTLSNWHYKPKAPQANINVVTDVATIMMEEARPAVGGAVNGSAALAPQEIYTPGDGKTAGERVLKSGASIAKEEMTREDKAKLRRQRKKNQRKANAEAPGDQPGKSAERQQLVSDLKKGGVKLIGKQGEVTDIHGKANGTNAKNGTDTLKL